eukprot:CAMPEP_0172191790 /NCGR_PEP_ID=MMETSP1050-20130122/23928_1 /TAXON_ID=233186 /ORGANISM="Cryptomonas curvata, Strain CCAP979/52" /LENGTH=483 /DNA_ID=CAMNT_0012866941 /DNA_START=55 /DNA_END=1503 /DNA_ORIENTATION=+
MEFGTQFEHPGSRPSSAQGRLLTAGRYSSFSAPRSKSTEPNASNSMPPKRLSTTTPVLAKGGEGKIDLNTSQSNTRLPALRQPPEQTPFLLPLQRVYSPQLLLNHLKSTRSLSRMSAHSALDDSLNPQNRSLTPSASIEDSFLLRTKIGESGGIVQPFRSRSTESLNPASAAAAGPPPSIFGNVNRSAKQLISKRGDSPTRGGKPSGSSKDLKGGKGASIAVEEVDTVITSAKDLREAKELFRQFDTDGDGTLTLSEIQASLYYNNVDYEEIQAILGPNGIKCSLKERVSVEDFAQFLCKRRRENANRHQNFQLAKHSRIMRVYVSSCLHQHHAERQALHDSVFPRLADLCSCHGGELRVVDLRYHAGPCEATGSGPGQAEVLQELARAATDANYFYVGLVADLPGEGVLPAEVSPAEYEILKASARIFESTGDDRGLVQALEGLYRQDLNTPGQAYALQPGPDADAQRLLRAFADYDGDDRA